MGREHGFWTISLAASLVVALHLAPAAGGLAAETGEEAKAILKLSGVTAGICARVGTTDGKLEAELGAAGNLVVHGLAFERAVAEGARKHIESAGRYGRVSVETGSFKELPYAENLVNLLVAEDLSALQARGLELGEVFRVLTPNGVLCTRNAAAEKLTAAGFKNVRTAAGWTAATKPRPAGMDDWSHAWHGPDNNLVSADTLVKPSPQLQWVAGPDFGHHRGPIGAVTAGGRLFYVLYDNPLDVVLAARVFLAARDAYNGKLLWKLPLPNTTLLLWGQTPFFRPGTLVAAEDRVFAVLEPGAPLSALDATTGKVLRKYDGLPSPDCVVHCGKTLILTSPAGLHAADVDSGALLWKNPAKLGKTTQDWQQMHCLWKGGPLAVAEGKAFFLDGENLVCLEARTGKQVWRTNADASIARSKGGLVMGPCYRGVVILRGRGGVHAFSTADGKHLWSESGSRGYGLGGLIWVWFGNKESKKHGWHGLDLKTGEEKRVVGMPHELPANIKGARILDGQCNHPLATENYFITTTRMSLVDARSGEFHNTMITRGPCKFLLAVPANGLLYSFPKDCGCYPCLRGMMAYAPAPAARRETQEDRRLEKGPVHADVPAGPAPTDGEWPTHRHDARRSGSTPSVIPTGLKQLWSSKIDGRLSAPTIAAGKVFVASVDTHRIHALDARTGEPVWTFTAGARVDSPPTVHKGTVIFGCRNGWVYCLRADDGKLVWRYLAAPEERRIGSHDQLESPWPVHGAVLVHDDALFFSAGRHANAEGGIRVHGMDPAAGRLLWRSGPAFEIVNDVLRTGAGGNVYLGPHKVAYDPKTGKPVNDDAQLRTPWAGMLNDSSGGWWGGMHSGKALEAFDSKRTLTAYAGPTGQKYGKEVRVSNVPGKGYEMVMTGTGPKWSLKGVPVRVNALVLTPDKALAAGPLDFPSEAKSENPWAVIDGSKGARLLVLSAADGRQIEALDLESPPVFDGMAVANGRVFLSGQDGRLRCWGKP